MNDRFLSLMAVGDAFGMKYEFVTHDQSVAEADLHFGPNPNFAAYQAGEYTDDTQMSLANAELLLSPAFTEAAHVTDDALIAQWLAAFKRDKRLGYSQTMYAVLDDSESPQDFRARVKPELGVTSGAAMRAGPFGLLPDVNDVRQLAARQARITHNTPAGVNAALAVALTTHHLHYGGSRAALPDYLKHHLGDEWNREAGGYTDSPNNGVKIVSQALHAIAGPKTYSGVLLRGVNQSPHADTDTVCALALLFASRCADITDDLPEALNTDQGRGPYDRTYLHGIDRQLLHKFPVI